MNVVTFINQPIPRSLVFAVLEIVGENIEGLSKQKVASDSPMFDLAKEQIIQEIGMYLSWCGAGNGVHLIAADEQQGDKKELLGFMLITAHLDGSKVAGLNYTAVRQQHRRKGVLREMMSELTKHYPVVGLGSSIENVPIYERLGFSPVGARGTQISMTNGVIPRGQMASVDMDFVNQLPTVKKQKEILRDRFGKKVKSVYDDFKQLQVEEAERVKQYLKGREVL